MAEREDSNHRYGLPHHPPQRLPRTWLMPLRASPLKNEPACAGWRLYLIRSGRRAWMPEIRKRPDNRGAPKLRSSDPHAAILAALPSSTFLAVVMGIVRGFIVSGTTRTRSTCRSPFSRLAPLIWTWSAS